LFGACLVHGWCLFGICLTVFDVFGVCLECACLCLVFVWCLFGVCSIVFDVFFVFDVDLIVFGSCLVLVWCVFGACLEWV